MRRERETWAAKTSIYSGLLPQIFIAQDTTEVKTDYESGYSPIESAMRDGVLVFYLQTISPPRRTNLHSCTCSKYCLCRSLGHRLPLREFSHLVIVGAEQT